jgi:hypothetical protein
MHTKRRECSVYWTARVSQSVPALQKNQQGRATHGYCDVQWATRRHKLDHENKFAKNINVCDIDNNRRNTLVCVCQPKRPQRQGAIGIHTWKVVVLPKRVAMVGKEPVAALALVPD